MNQIHILIVVNTKNRQSRWRRVDWEESDICTHISIWDNYSEKETPYLLPFDKQRFPVIILSWDVANGDPAFGSNITQQFIRHRRAKLLTWLEKGGILIIENQTDGFQPHQETYDVTLGHGEVIIDAKFPSMNGRQQLAGNEGYIEKSRASHPLICYVTNGDLKARPNLGPSFSEGSVPKTLEDIRTPEKSLYSGWFRKWKNGWETLIRTREGYPIMLSKKIGRGMIVVTTMYLGASHARDPILRRLREKDFLEACESYKPEISLKGKILKVLILSGAISAAVTTLFLEMFKQLFATTPTMVQLSTATLISFTLTFAPYTVYLYLKREQYL